MPAFFVFTLFALPAAPSAENYHTVAVIDNTDRLSDADTALTLAIDRVTSYRLEALPNVSVVPESELEMYFQPSDAALIWNRDKKAAAGLCRVSNSDMLLLGRHTRSQQQVSSEFLLIGCPPAGNVTFSPLKFMAASKNTAAFQKNLFEKLASGMKLGIPPGYWKRQSLTGGAKAFDRFGEGLRQLASQRPDAAMAAMKEALAAEPASRDINYFLGRYYATGQFNYERAVFHLDKVIEKNPDDAGAFYWLGFTCYLKADYGSAIKAFERAKSLEPDSVETAFMLATIYEDMGNKDKGNYDSAVANYRAALRQVPLRASIWYSLASVLAVIGRTDEALEALRRTFELDRDGFFSLAKTDSDLAPLRRTDGYRELMEKYKK